MKARVVAVSGAYSLFYWAGALGISFIFWFVPLPLFVWHKWRVVNRNKIILAPGAKTITIQRGRWFVLDDDAVPLRSIDNVKLDRSVLGSMFGWCKILLETRSEAYKIPHVSKRAAEDFRRHFLDGL